MLALVIVASTSAALFAADTLYQCTPSGFSLGVAPIRGPAHISIHNDLPSLLSYVKMRDMLAERLFKSALFSDVAIVAEDSQSDSSDLSLFVTIPSIEEVTGGVYPSYEMSVEVMLLENFSGTSLLRRTYSSRFESIDPMGLPILERFKMEILIGFGGMVPEIITDLDRVLNDYPDVAFTELKRSKTVEHSHLEPLWILPTLITKSRPGLENYSRWVEEQLHERLARKSCFTFPALADSLRNCLPETRSGDLLRIVDSLSHCPVSSSMDGMVLVTQLSAEDNGYRIHTLLLHLPTWAVIYDEAIITSGGWQLGNTLERHAAGVAQASHTVPH